MLRSTFTRACNDPDSAGITTHELRGLHDDRQDPLDWMMIPSDAVAMQPRRSLHHCAIDVAALESSLHWKLQRNIISTGASPLHIVLSRSGCFDAPCNHGIIDRNFVIGWKSMREMSAIANGRTSNTSSPLNNFCCCRTLPRLDLDLYMFCGLDQYNWRYTHG